MTDSTPYITCTNICFALYDDMANNTINLICNVHSVMVSRIRGAVAPFMPAGLMPVSDPT